MQVLEEIKVLKGIKGDGQHPGANKKVVVQFFENSGLIMQLQRRLKAMSFEYLSTWF